MTQKLEERKFLLECIEMYETLPALWNTKCKDYSNREKKNQQYDILLLKYKERFPKADKTELIKKFNSLRKNFRKELKKLNDFGKSGAGADDVSEPTLWYFDQMKFLTNTSEPCSSQSSMNYDVKNDIEESYVSAQKQICAVWKNLIIPKTRNNWVTPIYRRKSGKIYVLRQIVNIFLQMIQKNSLKYKNKMKKIFKIFKKINRHIKCKRDYYHV